MLKMSWRKKRCQIAKIAKTFGAINTGRAYTKAVPNQLLQNISYQNIFIKL